MDKLVIDIETKNLFSDVGGEHNLRKLDVSVVGVYSYNQDKYLCFDEYQMPELGAFFQRTGLIIGFSINRFDIPVLEKYFSFKLSAIPRLDILEEIEFALGHRVSLDILAKTNLGGIGKTHHGTEAVTLYRDGNMDELKSYCLNDVKLTKELYDLGKKRKFLVVPDRQTGVLATARFNWTDVVLPSTLF